MTLNSHLTILAAISLEFEPIQHLHQEFSPKLTCIIACSPLNKPTKETNIISQRSYAITAEEGATPLTEKKLFYIVVEVGYYMYLH